MTKPTIMIVEDQPLILDMLVDVFGERGFDTIDLCRAEDALGLLEAGALVDVIFTDIRLAGKMNGIELGVKAHTLRPNLPVMYATGFTDEMPVPIDAHRFFIKPYSVEAVVNTAIDLVQK